jgi:hypothetical protein
METNNAFNYLFILFSFYVQRYYERTRANQQPSIWNNYSQYMAERRLFEKRLVNICDSLSLNLFDLSMAIPTNIIDKAVFYKLKSGPCMSMYQILRQRRGFGLSTIIKDYTIPDLIINNEINPQIIELLISLQDTRVIHWETFRTLLFNKEDFNLLRKTWETTHPNKNLEQELFDLTGNPIWLGNFEQKHFTISVDEINKLLSFILSKKFLFTSNAYTETKILVQLLNKLEIKDEKDFLKLNELYKLTISLSGYTISLREMLCSKILDAYYQIYFSTERMKKFNLVLKFLRKEKTSDIWTMVLSTIFNVYYKDVQVQIKRTSYSGKTPIEIPAKIFVEKKSNLDELLDFYKNLDPLKYVKALPYRASIFKEAIDNPNTVIEEKK